MQTRGRNVGVSEISLRKIAVVLSWNVSWAEATRSGLHGNLEEEDQWVSEPNPRLKSVQIRFGLIISRLEMATCRSRITFASDAGSMH